MDSPAADMPALVPNHAHELELIRAARGGSLEAFDRLMQTHEQRIYNFVWRICGSTADAEDVTQETFIRAFRYLARYQERHAFSTWIYSIARHAAFDLLRRRMPSAPAESPEAADDRHPAALAEQADETEAIWQLARQLPLKYYTALWLRYGEGLSMEETARAMDKTVIYVKVLVHRARKQLAEKLARRNMRPRL